MQILVTNDDGIFAPGIYALAKSLAQVKDYEVYVVAPTQERSGASHSLTLLTPLRMTKTALEGLENVSAYAVNGTPVDCVKLGIGNLGIHPALVISGVNLGANLGTDVFYSGTASAAIEAALNGIPAIAVSVCANAPRHFQPAIDAAIGMIPRVLQGGCQVLNINAPDLPAAQIRGSRITACSRQEYEMAYAERLDTSNRKYYWIPAGRLTQYAPDEDTDERWTQEGYIAMVPLKLDLTDYACMTQWKKEQA